jgi:hypothetical protein
MATAAKPVPQSGQPVQVAGGASQFQDIASMLQTLLGSSASVSQSTNPGDITALQTLLGQLQGADYSALLQGIFQQAAGQIPGLQQGMGNAIGARSGGNSAVQSALQQLLQQTTLAGTQAVSNAQLQNQQIQAQAGNAVAQATKNTQQKTTNKQPGILPELAGLLAVLKGAQAVTGTKDLEGLAGAFGFGNKATSTTTPPAMAPQQLNPGGGISGMQPQASVFGAQAPQMSFAPPGGQNFAQALGGFTSTVPQNNPISGLNYDFSGGMSYAPDMAPTSIRDVIGAGGMSTSPALQQPNIMDYFNAPAATDYTGPTDLELYGQYY